jgi:hypothetical protein
MLKRLLLGTAAISLGGCAFVPELPNDEKEFSYAEIVNQIECETFDSVNQLEEKHDPQNPDPNSKVYKFADLGHWAIDISISPSMIVDAQIGISASAKTIFHQDTTKASDYFQTVLGGTAASPGGITYEGYGYTLGKNEYQFVIATLYDALTDKNGKPIPPALRTHKTKFECLADNQLNSAVPENDFRGGFFGIYEFLDRSLAATAKLLIEPKTIGYSKEYKKKIQVGVTPGWYTALSNVGPVAGAYGSIDNTIGVTFTPPTPASKPKPIPVYLVKQTTGGVAKSTTRPAVTPLTKFTVSPEQSDRLTNGANSLSIIQQFKSGVIPNQ